jgi:hypothetical protein
VFRQEQSASKDNPDLGRILAGIQESFNELKNASTQKKVTFGAASLSQREAEGRIVCHYCSRSGHYARNCFNNPRSQLFTGNRQGYAVSSIVWGPSTG